MNWSIEMRRMQRDDAAMKFTAGLLVAGTILLTSCDFAVPVRVQVDCALFKDQSFSAESKAWLRAQTPPETLIKDLDRVGKNTQLFNEYCKT